MENRNLFAAWNNMVNTEDLEKEIQKAAENKNEFPKIPFGDYDVSVEKMEMKLTKEKQKPMLSVQFKIANGKFEGQRLFMNQVIDPNNLEWRGAQLHAANEFLRSLIQECADAPKVEFKNFVQYDNLVMDIHELIADSFDYKLKYGQTKKGFDTFTITEVYTLVDDEDLPF